MRILNADERLEVQEDDAGYARRVAGTPYVEHKPEPTRAERTIRWIKGVPVQVWAGIGGVGAVGLIVYLVFFFFLFTHPVKVSAESFSWERQVEIEQFSQVRTGQWYDYPSDAYDVSHSQRVHHYTPVYVGQVSCGKDCTRSQYIDVPVYATWYDYTIDRWITGRWLVTEADDHEPVWADLPTTLDPSEVLGHEREGDIRKERYTVHTDKGYKVNVPPVMFGLLHVGSTGTANVTNRNSVRSVNWDLTPKTEGV